MSKRFGRNQKRRLVQELAQLQAVNNTHVEVAGTQIFEISRLRARLRDAEAVLGVHNPAFPPKQLEAPQPVPVGGDYQFTVPGGALVSPMNLSVRDFRDERQQVHAILTYKHHAWGYAITDQALATYPRDVLARHIANTFTSMLLDELNNLGVR